MNSKYRIIGLMTWLTAAVSSFLLLKSEMQAQSSSVTELTTELGHWLTSQHSQYTARSQWNLSIAREDPIFVQTAAGDYRQVGHVLTTNGTSNRDAKPVKEIRVEIYDEARAQFPDGFQLQYYSASLSLDNVVKTMLPKKRRDKIARLIEDTWNEERDNILLRLKPILRDGIRTALETVEEHLLDVLKRHEDEFKKIADRYEVDIVKADLLPLIKEQIFPIIEDEAVPVAEDIGRELWKKVSLVSFAWRFLYDKSPLPKRDAVKAEFQRFVDQDVVPLLNSRSDELLEVTENIVKRSMKNPKVRIVLKKNLKQVAEDKELHRLIWSIVKEAVVENDVLKARLEAHFRDERTKYAFKSAGEKMETMVRGIGDALFGTRETGITPEFSRVLRVQLLAKDRRWFVMVPKTRPKATATDGQPTSSHVIKMEMAADSMIYPMGFGGSAQSPLTPEKD